MVAYEGSRQVSERMLGQSSRDSRGLFLELKACPKFDFRYINHEGLAGQVRELLAVRDNAQRRHPESPRYITVSSAIIPGAHLREPSTPLQSKRR